MPRSLLLMALVVGSVIPAFAGVDEGLLALAPPGSTFIAGIQMDQSRASNFGQFLLSQSDNFGAGDSGFQKFVQQTGFDPRRDLQQVVFASTGGRSRSSSVILARGNFDKARMEEAAETNDGIVQKRNGIDVISQGSGAHRSAVAFLGDGIVAMADDATLQQIIAGRGTATKIDPALASQIAALSAKNNAWFITTVPANVAEALSTEKDQQQPEARILRSVVQVSGGVVLSDRVNVSIDAIARSPKDAVSLTDVVRMFASMAQTQRQSGDPKAAILASAIDQMSLSTDGSTVHLSLSFAEKDLEQLAALEPTGRHRSNRRGQTTK